MSTVAGWLMKSIASGVNSGSGNRAKGAAAIFRRTAGPGRIGRRRAATRRAVATICAHRGCLGTAELEHLVRGRLGIEGIGGEQRRVIDEHWRQPLTAAVRQGNDAKSPGESDEAVQGDVAGSEDPGGPDDGPGRCRSSRIASSARHFARNQCRGASAAAPAPEM